MSESDTLSTVSEKRSTEIITPKKVLRVRDTFGIHKPGDTSFLMSSETPFDQADVLKQYEQNGYLVVRNGVFDSDNPKELGIDMHEHTDADLAKVAGLEMPPKHPLQDILTGENPIIAKALYANRGELKYLLETLEQKAKFIAWLVANGRGAIHEPDREKAKQDILSLLSNVKAGTLTENDYKDARTDQWAFENKIETPSDYDTSYRVVADGYGNIQYAQLHRSGEVKETGTILTTSDHVPIFEDSIWGDDFSTLLTHPRSPLFLESKQFMSNVAQGGKRILLDGKKINDQEDRKVLEAHGINPDTPHAPQDVLEGASRVGVANRDSYPYTGIDFIPGNDNKNYFLEANSRPKLNPEAIGLSENSTNAQRTLKMMERISHSSEKRARSFFEKVGLGRLRPSKNT